MNDTSAAAILPAGEVHLDEWVAPEIADEHGYIRAGKLLEWMDVVGVLAATRHCRRPVVTASLDGMELPEPIRIGERVTMTASIAFTSDRSLGVSVSLRHGLAHEGTPRKTLAGYMTFVALDSKGRPVPVPQFQPETAAAMARFREGQIRAEFRKKFLSGQLPANGVPAGTPERDKVLFIRELLKLLPRSLKLPMEREPRVAHRGRHGSYVHKIEPVRGSKLNFHGTLYGGTLMRWIEGSAQLSARAHIDGAAVRLVGLHGLTFIRPVQRHVFIHIRSAVAHTAPDSLTTLVNVHAEDPLEGSQIETLRAFFTYAPIDARPIAPLECIGSEELAVFNEIEHRLALQRALRAPPRGEGAPEAAAVARAGPRAQADLK